ncbi:MAG TPA: DUF1743 domain-containing protein [Thermoplasmata archaeon]|nr:DUF1743 domain-containing protein [Thermoplasmata archaeon]
MWIGIDDTDGPGGGCTTFVLTELLRVARAQRVDLIGAPRLVRLNPNIPWKTRGNAALSARFGRGRGAPTPIGELPEGPAVAHPAGGPLSKEQAEPFLTAAWEAVLRGSERGPRCDPAMAAFEAPPPASFYYDAVRSVVRIPEARSALRAGNARSWTRGSARGLVGAIASVAWPGRRHTWELIAYRRTPTSKRQREVDPASVEAAARRFDSLFQCTDATTRRLLVTPHTGCPVLFGLRSADPEVLPSAFGMIRSEPVERWIVFRTNQGTGDHIVDRRIGEVGPYEPARLSGAVASTPQVLRGGHVRFRIAEPDGSQVECWAYEPTKLLPKVARSLSIGDAVSVWGGRGRDPAFRLEGIEVLRAPARVRGLRPPRCPGCHRATDSLGRLRGFRCSRCRRRFPPESAETIRAPAEFGPGTYHPTPSARRHLHPVA